MTLFRNDMKIITGFLLLIIFVVFLNFKRAEGVPTIYPRSTVIVEMMDGSIFAGGFQRLPDDASPAWIIPPHRELGAYNVYVRKQYGLYHHWTSSLTERRLPQNPTKPHVPFHIYIQLRNGRQISAKNLQFVDNRHRRLDPSQEVIYLAMPDGSVFLGEL